MGYFTYTIFINWACLLYGDARRSTTAEQVF